MYAIPGLAGGLLLLLSASVATGQTAWRVDHVTDLAEQYERAHDAIRRSLSGRKVSTDGPQVTAAQQAASDVCLGPKYAPLYAQIEADLAPWREHGITRELMDFTYHAFPDRPHCKKGAGVLVERGVPYIVTDTTTMLTETAHHARLIVAHLMLFQSMAERFGPTLPDVEFVFSTADVPVVKFNAFTAEKAAAFKDEHSRPRLTPSEAAKAAAGLDPSYHPSVPLPITGFCKGDVHAEILAPDVHFYMRGFGLVNSTQRYAQQFPWPTKNNSLFGRFSPYNRAVDILSTATIRQGFKGHDICQVPQPSVYYCAARKHFMHDYVRVYQRHRKADPQRLPHMDVAQQPKRSMAYHAAQRWLLHLDGQTCSSRLEQLLALGSLVLKEESGYTAFFHHLLKPYEHYLPMWRKDPADVEEALAWAVANDPYYTPGHAHPHWSQHDLEEEVAKLGHAVGNDSASIAAAQKAWAARSPAARIASAGAALVARYLSKEAVTCYWFKLLHELAKLQRFTPGTRGGRKYAHGPLPVKDFLASPGAKRQIRSYFNGSNALDL